MDPALFEQWMLSALITLLVGFMAFIVWDLAKKSGAGRHGTLILCSVLGVGVMAFVIKSLIIAWLETG
ncbi:hypothetical protein BZK31_24990 [Pseudomonas floridensis]|uniref:DUF2788 domain-containing protein n=1 Tax=Pseudomonas floridensis TaxID=1958950 RepID=A0A1X0MZ50_9PSED|nr:DUF2788 domain-containing protein [Pseudomonas floridensis]ORC55146.1 hypothetical protein BZK31_24990 [Pseudomonas floridensis]